MAVRSHNRHIKTHDDMEYIRKTYNVPARRGGRVLYGDKPGTIMAADGPYLRIRLDGEKRVGRYHPTYQIIYF